MATLGMNYTPAAVPAGVIPLLSAARGVWGNVDPQGFYYNGATYFTWINGQNGDVGVSKFVHSTTVVTSTVLAASSERDVHATPSVTLRQTDHRVIVMWSGHDSSYFRIWTSTNPEDISAGSLQTLGASDFTYFSQAELASESNHSYAFFREIVAGQGYVRYIKSTDGWASHAATVNVFTADTGHVAYFRIGTDWDRYIHVFATNTESNTSGAFLYHFYIDGADDSVHASDGTPLTLPVTAATATLVTNGISGGGFCMPQGVCVDGTGKPAALVRVGISGQTDNTMRVARWTGAAWQVNTVYTAGGIYINGTTWVYSPGATIHKTNPDIVYGSKKTAGHFAISKFVSPDSGTTWNETVYGSTNESIYPETPVNAAAGLDVFWPFGTALSDTDFNMGTQGFG